jgi:chemotaxis protein methyltransferase CheR
VKDPLFSQERREEEFWFKSILYHLNTVSGIALKGDDFPRFRQVLEEFLKKLEATGYRDLYYILRYHPSGKEYTEEFISRLTTGETYFYREVSQINLFFSRYFPSFLSRSKNRPLYVASFGCSTGEEPYTIAIVASEMGYSPKAIQIIGGDINRSAIERAREGIYREKSFVLLPQEYLKRYFFPVEKGYRVRDLLKEYVEFVPLNILDEERLRILPSPCGIFLRNVFLYFDEESRRKAMEIFFRILSPGGVLFLGSVESLLHFPTLFRTEILEGEVVFVKPHEV